MKARFFALAALVLGLASCQKDFNDTTANLGGEVDFQLSVGATELTRAGENGVADEQNAKNSAYGAIDYFQGADWNSVDLRYSLEVYDANALNAAPVKDRQVIIVDKYEAVSFDLRLVPNRTYQFVVFADFVPEGEAKKEVDPAITAQANLGLHHVIGNDLRDIKIKEDAINDESTDAYFISKDLKITNSIPQSLVLQRPYGKIRVIATDLAELNLNVEPKTVFVKYEAAHPSAFNAVTGAISTEYKTAQYKYEYADITKESLANHVYTAGYDAKKAKNANNVERHTHMTLFTDYILAEAENMTPHHFKMTVFDQNGTPIKETEFSTDIPVERNHLTTVIGNVLTTATEINITIDDNFADEYTYAEDIDTTPLFLSLLEEASNSIEATIDLSGDVVWATGASHGSTPLMGENAKTQVLTINGNGNTFTATGNGIGAIRMANGGKVIFNNVKFVDESVSYAENSWEHGYLEFAGNLEFNNCEFVNAIMVCGETANNKSAGNANFNNCSFNSHDNNQYGVWVSGNRAYFNKCTFEGPRGLKVHEDYGSEVEKVVVDNCQFNNLSKKPGIALGTLNADTTIVICNSTFNNCQPGDQGLYIYESDTDVNSFTLTEKDNTVVVAAPTAEDFANALKLNTENIEVVLAANIDCPISSLGQQTGGSGEYKLGGENTNYITIDLNGKKLNITTSYWSGIGAKNDNALFTIKNGTMTSSQATGTWNSYDVTFANCNYAIENVTFEKSIAFTNAEKAVALKNVTINETHDYYAMWISAKGQNVDINGLTVNAENGRGIKVDEQYVSAPAKVTLNVANADFNTAKKAAIVVKSQAGADINLANVDISNVYADPFHAVWVDEDAAAYADFVTVKGGKKMVEGDTKVAVVRGNDAMSSAIANGAETVYLNEGSYILPSAAKGKTVSFVGVGDAKDTTIAVTKVGNGGENCDYALDGSNATFENLTIATNGSTYIGYARCNGTYKNCIIDNTYTLYGNSTFEGCTFNVSGDKYNVWTWGAPEATFTNCTFNCDGKSMLLYGQANTKLTMNNCVFNDNGDDTVTGKAAIEIGNDYNKSYELTVNNATVNGFAINPNGFVTGTTLWANKNSMGQEKLNVVVDGVDVY